MNIYQRVLGSDFRRLHPQIQRRFGLSAEGGVASIGRGIMHRVWRGPAFTIPFLFVGTWRRIIFPERARRIPFTIENYAFRDPLGRETVTWCRTFHLRNRRRRFDAYMVNHHADGHIVDYLGSHQHLAVDIDLRVDAQGGLCLRSGAQRFCEGPLAFTFPNALTGIAEVREWFDEASGRFQIRVVVRNRHIGPLFGYRGSFVAEFPQVTPDSLPPHLVPRRFERRD